MFRGPFDRRAGRVAEVKLGATSKEGGTRGWSVVVGGGRCMPLHLFEGRDPSPPLVAPVVFEGPLRLPRPLKEALREVVNDPVAWAEFAVEELGARLVFACFLSPLRGEAEASLRALERLLDEVRAPLIVGGPEDVERPHIDAEFLSRAAEVASGERVALSYATLDQYSEVAGAARRHGHAVVAYSPNDVNLAKQLNANLLGAGLSREDVIIDPTAAPLGWSFEYSYSTFERIRLLALQGDELLQMPLMAAAHNAWTARESYSKRPELGPVEQRGILWEAVTALSYAAAGADLVLALHPEAYRLVESMLSQLWSAAGPVARFEQLFGGR